MDCMTAQVIQPNKVRKATSVQAAGRYQFNQCTETYGKLLNKCSDPSYESDPSNEYSPLGLTHVMNSIFLDPSNEFLTQAVNIGIPK